ncbi:MAG: PKD domain-containing protein, partial [Bacteroidota bacterium]
NIGQKRLKIKTLSTFKKLFLLFLLSAGFSIPGYSAHIVGGEMTYECLGGDNYRITMRVYRDCFSGGAPFDAFASITIYRGDQTNIDNPFRNLDIQLTASEEINLNVSNPCLVPPNNVCVQRGDYTFDINLPFHPSGYHVSYQRCCRNETINNIFMPGDVGATYTTLITGQSLQACNSSPEFNDFPPIVICANEFINFDHAATDADGDSLVYRFCTPLTGGGTDGVDNNLPPTGPNGVRPDPATPPPYTPVDFIGSLYSIDQPLGQPANASIDPATGLLDGLPPILGQFVVGICVDEYRNGTLLSSTRREFQFNIVSCERAVTADIVADSMPAPQEFVVLSCGDSTFAFINTSFGDIIDNEFLWSFDFNNGEVETSSLVSPIVTFPGLGSYQGFLVANPSNPTCSDTARITVNIFPEIVADWSFDRDSCALEPVQFINNSFTGAEEIELYAWDFGDGGTSNEENPSYQFAEAGIWTVRLRVTDNNGCSDEFSMEVPWFPSATIDLGIEGFGCQPVAPFSANNSFPTEGYTFEWEYGDGSIGNGILPLYIYETPGVYDVTIRATSPFNCVSERFFPEAVTVLTQPRADFEFSPQELTNFSSTVNFTDLSENAFQWFWDFGNGDGSSSQNPTYEYPDTGMFDVQLVVRHPDGCQDTIVRPLDVVPRYSYFLPNAFTPNFDGLNDQFKGTGDFFGIERFEMTIWNRWGELVFRTNNPNDSWNGTKGSSGKLAPQGVYVYAVNILGNRNQEEQRKGFVTLIR